MRVQRRLRAHRRNPFRAVGLSASFEPRFNLDFNSLQRLAIPLSPTSRGRTHFVLHERISDMRTKLPKCPDKVKTCPGSSDDAYVHFDEDVWDLFQAMCPMCQCDWHIRHDIPFDDEDELAA